MIDFLTSEVTFSMTGPLYAFFAGAFLILIAGKALQQGGVQYGRGERWEAQTLLGVLVLAIPFIALVAFSALAIMEPQP